MPVCWLRSFGPKYPGQTVVSSRSGFGLLEVIVLVAILGLLAFWVSNYFTTGYRALKSLEYKADLLDVKRYVLSNLACPTSRPPACDDSTAPFVSISRVDSGELVQLPNAGNYTRYGTWYALRASCLDCPVCTNGKKLFVEVAREDGQGNFSLDPLSKRPMGWRDLFDGMPIGCVVPL